MKRILVVCTGNICRTPMAKALLQREVEQAGLSEQVVVDSAGVYAVVGGRASRGSVNAMAERGLDITDHRGKQLDFRLMDEADLILVMEESHRRSIFMSWPQALRKTFLLSEMVGDHADVEDPYGMAQVEYDKTAVIIEDLVRQGFPEILRRLDVS